MHRVTSKIVKRSHGRRDECLPQEWIGLFYRFYIIAEGIMLNVLFNLRVSVCHPLSVTLSPSRLDIVTLSVRQRHPLSVTNRRFSAAAVGGCVDTRSTRLWSCLECRISNDQPRIFEFQNLPFVVSKVRVT